MLMARAATPDTALEGMESLLLREFAHRAMNELAVARSAVAIARCALPTPHGGSVAEVLDQVALRLEGSGGLMRMLAGPVAPQVELGTELARLARAVLGSRPEAAATDVQFEFPEVWIDGALARRIVLIAAEMVGNACRHALAHRAGKLSVRLRVDEPDLILEVADDGALDAPAGRTSGTGFGGGIVAGLARAGGGSVALHRCVGGTVAILSMPIGQVPASARAHCA